MSYEKEGDGMRPLLLFHGFGLKKEVFASWMDHLTSDFTVYSFDLFHHGESVRHGKLTKEEWIAIIGSFMEEQKIHTFSVLGYSLGARFAIPCALEMPDLCRDLILIAPDAVYKTPWFKLATFPVSRSLFYFFMKNPKAMERLIQTCVNLKIVSKYIADFVEIELGKEDNRMRVYHSWNDFKSLGYTKSQLQEKLFRSTTRKILFLGKKDFVIPPSKIRPLIDQLDFEIIELNRKHHQMIRNDVAAKLAELLH